MGKNYYIFLPRKTGRLQWLPWDLDLSFGGYFFCGTVEQRVNLSIRHPYSCGDPTVERILGFKEFDDQYRAHLARLITTHFEPSKVHSSIDQVGAVIRDAVRAEGKVSPENFAASLGTSDIVPAIRAGGNPMGRDDRILLPPLKDFVTARVRSVQKQLRAETTGDQVSFWKR
jgi:hypothetical protein